MILYAINIVTKAWMPLRFSVPDMTVNLNCQYDRIVVRYSFARWSNLTLLQKEMDELVNTEGIKCII